MLNYVLKKIKGFFQKNRRQNNIQIDSVKNGNIYQDSIIKVENPAIAISHIKDNPEDLKITLDSISNIFLRQSKALPQGYQVVVKMKDGKVYTYESVVDGSGEQFETGSSGKLYGKFTETVTTKKILEVKQIKALLFFKKSAGDSESYRAEDYYEIPLEVEK